MCHHESIYSVNDRQVCMLETEKKKERKKRDEKKALRYPKPYIATFFAGWRRMFWIKFIPPRRIMLHRHTPSPRFVSSSIVFQNEICSFMRQQWLLCLCVYVSCARVMGFLNLGLACEVCAGHFRGRGRWQGQVLKSAFWISCFLFIAALMRCSTRLWPLTPPEQKHILRRIAVLVTALSRLVTWPLWPDIYSHLDGASLLDIFGS